MLLMGSPRWRATAARQNAAATAIAAQMAWVRSFFMCRRRGSELFQAPQRGLRVASRAQRHPGDRLPRLIHGSDVAHVVSGVTHQNDGVGTLRIRQTAELNSAGFALPAVL